MTKKRFHTVTSINGRIVAAKEARVSVFDNSLLYAEGLFETCLAIGDEVMFLPEHFRRLKKGSAVLGMRLPASSEQIERWIIKTTKTHPSRIKKIRLTITSGESARWVGEQGKQQVIVSASPHVIPVSPFKLWASDFRVDQDSVFRRIKTLSYAIHAAALTQAKEKNLDDALLLNERGEVAEVTSANIFWVKDRTIYTPSLEAGCLEGVTRAIIIREAQKFGLEVLEMDSPLGDLLKADEIFISSSLKLAAAVGAIRIKNKTHKLPLGPITKLLSDRFLQLVGLNKNLF